MINNRIIKAYLILGKTHGLWISPILTGILLLTMRTLVSIGLFLDKVFIENIRKTKLKKPIVIVGNPRSGTTFLQRYLIKSGLGVGSQLWQLIYPSVLLQKIIKPILPILEKISPARHHSTVAHKTSLTSIETDDVSLFFRHLDGFFLYGFILAFDDEDQFKLFDPSNRNTTQRDYDWFEQIWIRAASKNKDLPYIGKLFSLSSTLPHFLKRFDDAKILYMIRDPLNVIPSGLSLVTGVLDKKFDFWNLPEQKRNQYIRRLYSALVELLKRFHDDWINGNIDTSKVFIVRYDKMMNDFEGLMKEIMNFVSFTPTSHLLKEIKATAQKQRNYTSEHKYDLEKFGLSEKKIKKDCQFIYKTFLND